MGGFLNQPAFPDNLFGSSKSKCRVVREAEGTIMEHYEGHMLKLKIGSSQQDVRIARQVLEVNLQKNLQQEDQNQGHENLGSTVQSSLLWIRDIQKELETKLLPRIYSLIIKVRDGQKLQFRFIDYVRKGIIINEKNLNLLFISTFIFPKLRLLENNLKYELQLQLKLIKVLKKNTAVEIMGTNNFNIATASASTNSSKMLEAVPNEFYPACAPAPGNDLNTENTCWASDSNSCPENT